MAALWTADEVATRAQVSSKLIYKLVASGELPCVRYGTRVLFRPQDVEAWEQAQIEESVGA
jgi:excisionase family DNA binding protein